MTKLMLWTVLALTTWCVLALGVLLLGFSPPL